jgi:hypothetical protein
MIRAFAYAAALSVTLTLTVIGSAAPVQHVHRPATGGLATPMKAHTGPLPALPAIAFEPPRPLGVIEQVYAFAARHPEVLQYVPCYCGCERSGHSGNHDCFVKSRRPDGRVIEWETHGIGCTICIDVARDAQLLFDAGSTAGDIRAAIDRKYGSRYRSATPTPQPTAKR